MAKVSAVILIYDIRGFTAASKKLPTADLGAFADAAHRAILERFAARPADFVKNLGDGHLLIWETNEDHDPSIVRFVVEAADEARKAFPIFVAEHLAAQALEGLTFPTRIGFGVATGEVSKSDDYYGAAVNLAARLQNMARPSGLALDSRSFHLAGPRAVMLKRGFKRTKVNLKGLGTTPVWTDRPFSWQRLLVSLIPLYVILIVPMLYLTLADWDSNRRLPGSLTIQNWLDSQGISIFRPVRSDAEIREAAKRTRGKIADAILAARHPDGRISTSLDRKEDDSSSVWGSSQAISGLLSIPELDAATKRSLIVPYAAGLFSPDEFIPGYGWRVQPDREYTLCEPACWTIVALARSLGTPGVIPESERPIFEQRLRQAQEGTAIYRPLDTGGWNIFPNQSKPGQHSIYSTSLGLLALLETQSAGLPWAGSIDTRDELLVHTARFLISQHTGKKDSYGWRRSSLSGEPISEGLTMQLYSELLRAEKQAAVPLPSALLEDIPRHLVRLRERAGESDYDAGEFIASFTSHKGVEIPGSESINFLWHSWAIDTATRWLEREKHGTAPRAEVMGVQRALGHLVVDMEASKTNEAVNGMSFVGGETLFGLSIIPPP